MPNRFATLMSRQGAHRQQVSRRCSALRLWQPHVWLYLPIYLALMVALGAVCRALAHFLSNGSFAIDLWAALIVNLTVSFGTQCGNETIRSWSHRARLALFLLIPLFAFFLNGSLLAPLHSDAEINAKVAIIIGWSSLLCVLLMGIRYSDRRLPFAAPLVPGLSLFGLLNSLSVDTLIQVCFLFFVAAALYIVVYEPMLNNREANSEVLSHSRSRATALPTFPQKEGRFSKPEILNNAVSYLVACSVWFSAFMAGAALFYYPVSTFLPRALAGPFNGMRPPAAALLDWRGGTSMMELRGGNYPLSDRVVMKVMLMQGDHALTSTPVLWRGRTFENYDTSRWFDAGSTMDHPHSSRLTLREGAFVQIPAATTTTSRDPILAQAKARRAAWSPRLVKKSVIEAYIEPEQPASRALYSPGELLAVQSMLRSVRSYADGSVSAEGFWRNVQPYVLRASVKQQRITGLTQAPGLTARELKAWRADDDLAPTLELSPQLRSQLAPIIERIRSQAAQRGLRIDTPYAKACAIHEYLLNTCKYSLSSPLVPATEDAVIYFMSTSQRGACDMFASSMTLLLRALNVPARLATGYIAPDEITTGNVSPQGNTLTSNFGIEVKSDQVTPGGTSTNFTLRAKDAHAWVEYFVPNAGWLSFDPTAGTRTTQMPLEDQVASFLNFPQLHINRKALLFPLCGLFLIGLGLCWTYLGHAPVRTRQALSSDEISCQQITVAYQQALRLLRRYVPSAPHQTPHEYEVAVNRAPLPLAAKQEFAALTYLLICSRYGGHAPAMSRDELQSCLRRLQRALKSKRV